MFTVQRCWSFLSITIPAIYLLFPTISSATTCYRPNGVEGNSDIRPCHTNLASGQNSACCNLGKSPPDLCLAGGLCYRQDGYDGNFLIYAVGCTDSTGADAACQQYCPAGKGVVMYSLNACLDGRWCCNDLSSAESCCDKSTGEGSFTMNHLLSLDPTPFAIDTGAAATVITTTVTGTQSSGPSAPCNATLCPNNNGTLVGASVGAAVGGFIIAVLASCIFMRKFKLSSRHRKEAGHGSINTAGAAIETERQFGWRHEMDSKGHTVLYGDRTSTNVSELPHGTAFHEIDGRSQMK